MHDEDGKFGIRVTNARGDRWVAYGDCTLFKEESKDNQFRIVKEAVQASVDQVLHAFKFPTKEQDPNKVTDYIQFVDKKTRNSYPMFRMSGDGELLRRVNLNDLGDASTISNLWAWSTLVDLKSVYDPHKSAIP